MKSVFVKGIYKLGRRTPQFSSIIVHLLKRDQFFDFV